MRRSPLCPARPPLSASCRLALGVLLDAHKTAQCAHRSTDDFACQLPNLQRSGVSETDLRYLVAEGLALHLTEFTAPGDSRRRFHGVNNLRFSEASSFVLTVRGLARAAELLGDLAAPRRETSDRDRAAPSPRFDLVCRTLFLGVHVVKRFRVPATNQELILRVFEEEGWPPRILDPLPQIPGVDPKKRLHDAMYRLNTRQQRPLLAFVGDGTSKGLLWRRIDVGSTVD